MLPFSVTPEMLAYAVAALVLLQIISLGLLVRSELRMKRLLLGKSARTLEDVMRSLGERQAASESFQAATEAYLMQVEKRLRRSLQGIETVRFNPFKGAGGGNQSFATAFISEDGDGVIISSLYARDRMSVFAKPVRSNASPHELSEEEEQVLRNAAARIRTP